MPFDLPVSTTVTDTHAAVLHKLEQRLKTRGHLMFFTADTGTGKTTGFQRAIKRIWETKGGHVPFLIMVPNRKAADQCWLDMEELCPGMSSVWTQAHDPGESVKAAFTPSVQFTKSEAAKYPCLIITHNAGKDAEDWVGRRDAVIIDEYPEPVTSGILAPCHFVQARDEEAEHGPNVEVFREAADWADKQDAKGLAPVGLPAWVAKVLAVTPATEAGRVVQELAQCIHAGTAFQKRRYATSWAWYRYDLPFEERAIIFSATAASEGWHFDPLCSGRIEKDGPVIDYSRVTANLIPWPDGVPKYHRQILSDYRNREMFFDYLGTVIGLPGEDTLIVCPKDFESDIVRMFPHARVTHWGVDVGSNAYRDCTTVWLVSEPHKPQEVHVSRYLGHSKTIASKGALDPVGNSQKGLMKTLKNESYAVGFKQMIARGSCRKVDAEGKAAPMTVNCIIDRDRFASLIPVLFPGCKLVFPEGCLAEPVTEARMSTISKLIAYLANEKKDYVSSLDLKDAGIDIKGEKKKAPIREKLETFEAMGWTFEEGSPGRYGRPAGFRRIKGRGGL